MNKAIVVIVVVVIVDRDVRLGGRGVKASVDVDLLGEYHLGMTNVFSLFSLCSNVPSAVCICHPMVRELVCLPILRFDTEQDGKIDAGAGEGTI